ncbi:pyrroloquinoline quinone biosynthesis peptide chaperone PqqD [Bosea sp. BK604]|uniref:pyrroloquinoline quinone biosynthesis peptide chaperone PqqD n=1 Tax=Bosea sp. BK604 TaxID=2512180 RepID=UPI0010EC3FA6|nr:pyrroloquinoline quinone biosynthesis peptide chaperone PqqD [Bosea sp. BK604]TCR67100.1 pyrroloquinoline quinone biosynthesis protein D [Bosea sp. BK604]
MTAETTQDLAAQDLATIVPALPRGVRLRFDEARQQWFLLGPERVFEPDETAIEILQRIDGTRSVEAIAEDLATRFEADRDEIAADVMAFLRGLANQRMIDL